MLRREEKANVVRELAERFRKQRVSIFTDLRGISVAELSRFRRELRKSDAEFKVTKKTFLRRALETVGIAIEPKQLDGEIGVIFGYQDQVAPAKAAAAFSREHKTFRMLKGVLEGQILEAGDVLALAKLPGRAGLLGQLAYVLNAPLQGLAIALQGNLRNLVVALNHIKGKK